MLDQYGGKYPDSDHGHIIYHVATEYKDIDIKTFESEQNEICQKREARAKERIKQLSQVSTAR